MAFSSSSFQGKTETLLVHFWWNGMSPGRKRVSGSSSNVSSYVSWFSTRKRNEFNDDDDNDDVGLCCLRDTNITTTTGKWDKFQDFVSLPRSTSFVFIHWIVLIISNDDGWLVLFFCCCHCCWLCRLLSRTRREQKSLLLGWRGTPARSVKEDTDAAYEQKKKSVLPQ